MAFSLAVDRFRQTITGDASLPNRWDAWDASGFEPNELSGTFSSATAVCSLGWQSKRFDEEQNVFYSVARWYDQRIGRFTQPDPAEGLGIVTTGGEGYGWPGRDGIGAGDPTGMLGRPSAPVMDAALERKLQWGNDGGFFQSQYWVCYRDWAVSPREKILRKLPPHAYIHVGQNPWKSVDAFFSPTAEEFTWGYGGFFFSGFGAPQPGPDIAANPEFCLPCKRSTSGTMEYGRPGMCCKDATDADIRHCIRSAEQKRYSFPGYNCHDFAFGTASSCCLTCYWEPTYRRNSSPSGGAH